MICLSKLLLSAAITLGQTPIPVSPAQPEAASTTTSSGVEWNSYSTSGFLVGETAFPRFIAPVTNPVLAKDPRASTYARALFIHNEIDSNHPLGGGDLTAAGLQLGLAVTDRLTIIADKDGYAWLNPRAVPRSDGWLNLGAGLKYTLIRDVENQFLLSGGFMYEIPSGSNQVFQGTGDGTFTFFTTVGKEWYEKTHFLGTMGYQVPLDSNQNSSFIFTSLHLDHAVTCWLYPFVEANWFHWVQGGNHGLPSTLGEGDGLINFGTSGVAGNDFFTLAFGARVLLSEHISTGLAWEFPVSNRKDLMDNRVTLDLIFRY